MKTESSVKQGQIIETAIRRFSHFGIQKTTLAEIADDLSLSKQALAYYFPDKQCMVQAVQEQIAGDYKSALQAALTTTGSVKEALINLTEVKRAFFEKYFMLVTDSELLANMHVGQWRQAIKQDEMKLLQIVFKKGVDSGELNPLDVTKTSELYLDTLYAFSRCMKDKGIPDASAFSEVFTRQQEVTELFYNGLKTSTWKS
jgi:TetR/AcrR family transcriptional regulator